MTVASVSTVVVELTPPGRAAVAVVLLAGPQALQAVQHFFSPASPWKAGGPPIGRIMLGRWSGEHGEELILCRRAEDRFEIHCHGGGAAAPAIIRQLVDYGCQELSWQDWLRFPRSRVSPTRESESRRDSATCKAQTALADAPTERTAGVLLDQLNGALSKAVDAARDAIAAAEWTRAASIVDDILQFRDVGLHLTTSWQVVIAGAPNVGKSSLMNAIAGYQRAIVSPIPGTTRDVVTIRTAIDGWPVQFADTAGIRETGDELESAGAMLAGEAAAVADLVLVVSDASEETNSADEREVPSPLGRGQGEGAFLSADSPSPQPSPNRRGSILKRLPASVRVIQVLNKTDLITRLTASAAVDAQVGPAKPQLVSALTGAGISDLIDAIGGELVPQAPPARAAVAFLPAQVANLEMARSVIDRRDAIAATAALAAMLAT